MILTMSQRKILVSKSDWGLNDLAKQRIHYRYRYYAYRMRYHGHGGARGGIAAVGRWQNHRVQPERCCKAKQGEGECL